MGLFDGVNYGSKTSARSSNLTAKGRILSAIEQQIKIANGESINVSNPKLAPKSWWKVKKDGVMGTVTVKVSSYILDRWDCTEQEYPTLLEDMKNNVLNGNTKDTEDDLQSRLDTAKKKKEAKKG